MHVGQLILVSVLVLGTDSFFIIVRKFTDRSSFHESPAVKSFNQGWDSVLAPDLPSDFPVTRMRRLELSPSILPDTSNK